MPNTRYPAEPLAGPMDHGAKTPPDAVASTELTIVIPVKNEQPNIEPLISEILAVPGVSQRSLEIIMVDDGSTDGTLVQIQTMVQQHPSIIRWLSFDRNYGQTAAFDAGLRAATGRFLATMDGDLQNDPKDLPKLMDALSTADMAIGYRKRRQDTAVRRISSRIGNGIRNRMTRDDVIDTGCSLKVMRRECFRDLKLFEGMHRFLPTLVKLQGFKVIQLPVNHRPRLRGQAKYGVWNRVFRASADLLAVCWMQRRHLSYTIKKKG